MVLPTTPPAPVPPARRAPWVPAVVREPGVAEAVDWSSWYLTDEDDMGQNPRQSEAIRVLRDVVATRAEELGLDEAFVGTDAFFAWMEDEPLVRVSPDVFVVPSRPEPLPASFQLWRPGHVAPTLAVEIVSQDWKKDYDQGPEKYALLGVEELVVFDPDVVDRLAPRDDRFALQVFRRGADGLFARAYAGPGPARLATLEAWAVVAATDVAPVVRLARDGAGRELVPTPEEKAARERDEAARERDEAARERDEAARERDEERAARLRLEARIAALEAELAERAE